MNKNLKNKRKIILFRNIMIVLFTIICFNCLFISSIKGVFCKPEDYSYTKPIDSGWDTDYDYDYGSGGGSWGSGGSSWDYDSDDDWYSSESRNSSSSYSNSDNDGGPVDVGLFFGLILAFFGTPLLIYIVIRLSVSRSGKNHRKAIRKKNIVDHLPYPSQIQDKQFNKFVYETYVQIQTAWRNRDLTSVRHLLSDEMFNMYEMQIAQLKRYKQINIMKNFKYNFAYVHDKNIVNDVETCKVILSVTCKDYVIDEKTNRVIKGNSNDVLTYFYELTFVKNKNKDVQNCPNCGVKIDNEIGTNCPYCNSVLHTCSDDYTLTNKKMLYQFKE